MVVRTGDKNDGHVMPSGCRRRGRGLGRHGHDRDMFMPLANRGVRIPLLIVKILEPVLPRELLPFDRGLLLGVDGRATALEGRGDGGQRLFDRTVAVNGMMAELGRPHVCDSSLLFFSLLAFSGHFVYTSSLAPYTTDARPGYGTSTHCTPRPCARDGRAFCP
jgi:hypothetical protein